MQIYISAVVQANLFQMIKTYLLSYNILYIQKMSMLVNVLHLWPVRINAEHDLKSQTLTTRNE